MKIKNIFADKRKILKFTIISVGILIVVLFSVIGVTYGTSIHQFCAVCHIMKPEYVTWEASSHSQVDCTACHVDPGLTAALKHKVVAAKELYMYLAKTYELPIQMTESIPDSRCLQCHSLKRKVSPSTDVVIPHNKHHDAGVPCVKCHQGVAHGKIASSGLTMDGDFNTWTKSKGLQIMVPNNTLPKMDLCMDCHGRRGVTVACEACHSGTMKPDSHYEKSFMSGGHGALAKKNIKYCDTCHAYIKAPGVENTDMLNQQQEDPVAKYLNSMLAPTSSDTAYTDYAKTNEFCVECHKKRPPSHDSNWPFTHGQQADKDQEKCMVCHSPRTDVSGVTPKAACSSCHPSIHANIPWRVAHPIEIPPKLPELPAKCFQCHVKDRCSTCHLTEGGKPSAAKPEASGPPPAAAAVANKPATQAPITIITKPKAKAQVTTKS